MAREHPLVWLARAALLAAIVVILYLSTAPAEAASGVGWDKANHALAFFILAGLLDYAWPRLRFAALKISLLLGYGLLIELIQAPLPQREFSLLDIVADGAGIALYLLLRPWLSALPLLRRVAPGSL